MSRDDAGTRFEERPADWLSWTEARARVLAAVEPLSHEVVTLEAAVGRALAEDVDATATLPPWDNSAMDGYAVRGADVRGASRSSPVALRVTGEIHAGDAPAGPVGSGEAVRIMTGAPLPTGADSVIRVEHTDAEDESGIVRVHRDSDRGRNIRPGGQDVRSGDTVLEAGHSIAPGVVGVLAALGRARVGVHRRPTVAIVATGDELKSPSEYHDVQAGRGIPESNGPMIAAAVAAVGGRPVLLDVVPDQRAALREALRRAAHEDIVVTLGGASMGEADLVKRALDDLGFRQDFWRVRMRPGSPFGLGSLTPDERPVPVFGLPGNPASAFVTFELFVRPALLRLAGHRKLLRRTVRARAGEGFEARGRKAYFLRVTLDGSSPPVATLTGPQGSGLVRGLATVDGLAIVPEDVDAIPEGSAVDVLLLDDVPGVMPWPAFSTG